jgi:hypothetical protein
MELGNMLFGVSRGEYEVSRDWQDTFWNLLDALGVEDYVDYDCDLFELHGYWWGDEDDPRASRPNFTYKPLGYELMWYKHPLRDSYANQSLTWEEFQMVIDDCIKWVEENDK